MQATRARPLIGNLCSPGLDNARQHIACCTSARAPIRSLFIHPSRLHACHSVATTTRLAERAGAHHMPCYDAATTTLPGQVLHGGATCPAAAACAHHHHHHHRQPTCWVKFCTKILKSVGELSDPMMAEMLYESEPSLWMPSTTLTCTHTWTHGHAHTRPRTHMWRGMHATQPGLASQHAAFAGKAGTHEALQQCSGEHVAACGLPPAPNKQQQAAALSPSPIPRSNVCRAVGQCSPPTFSPAGNCLLGKSGKKKAVEISPPGGRLVSGCAYSTSATPAGAEAGEMVVGDATNTTEIGGRDPSDPPPRDRAAAAGAPTGSEGRGREARQRQEQRPAGHLSRLGVGPCLTTCCTGGGVAGGRGRAESNGRSCGGVQAHLAVEIVMRVCGHAAGQGCQRLWAGDRWAESRLQGGGWTSAGTNSQVSTRQAPGVQPTEGEPSGRRVVHQHTHHCTARRAPLRLGSPPPAPRHDHGWQPPNTPRAHVPTASRSRPSARPAPA